MVGPNPQPLCAPMPQSNRNGVAFNRLHPSSDTPFGHTPALHICSPHNQRSRHQDICDGRCAGFLHITLTEVWFVATATAKKMTLSSCEYRSVPCPQKNLGSSPHSLHILSAPFLLNHHNCFYQLDSSPHFSTFSKFKNAIKRSGPDPPSLPLCSSPKTHVPSANLQTIQQKVLHRACLPVRSSCALLLCLLFVLHSWFRASRYFPLAQLLQLPNSKF